MKIEMFNVGALGTNCYFLINEDTNEMLIVDPGGHGEELFERIEDNNLICKGILLTHGHFDHTDGIFALKENMPQVNVYALKEEEETLNNPRLNMSADMGFGDKKYPADIYLNDNDVLSLAGLSFRVIATPGHTPGGCCFYFEEENTLVSGDTLFAQSIGRTDFPGGSMETISASIKNRLYILPEETLVLPGHMGSTTIGDEKKYNMFVR